MTEQPFDLFTVGADAALNEFAAFGDDADLAGDLHRSKPIKSIADSLYRSGVALRKLFSLNRCRTRN